MQTKLHQLIESQPGNLEIFRIIGSLDNGEVNLLLADIAMAKNINIDYSQDTKLFLSKCQKILLDSLESKLMPSFTKDNYGNALLIFDYEGTEGEFWISNILGTDFRAILQRTPNHIVYAHPDECKMIEFNESVVYVRFGNRNSLIKYLTDVSSSMGGIHKCLFSPSYCLEFMLDPSPFIIN